MGVSLARRVSRFFKKSGLVGYSKRRNVFDIHPLVISTVYIAAGLAIAHLLRKLADRLIVSDSIWKNMLLEFIATIELCAACYELIIISENWGVWTYAIYLFLLTIWWGRNWCVATACPNLPVEECVEGSRDISSTALLIFAQLLGALATFKYVQILWAMELAETHRGKAFEKCTADLQVHFMIGAIIEAVATCACRIMSRVLGDIGTPYGSIMDAFFGTMMVVAAFNYSGGYFNPALATSLKLGCKGNTFIEHVAVYWIGATAGSVLSIFLYRSPRFRAYIDQFKAHLN